MRNNKKMHKARYVVNQVVEDERMPHASVSDGSQHQSPCRTAIYILQSVWCLQLWVVGLYLFMCRSRFAGYCLQCTLSNKSALQTYETNVDSEASKAW